MCVHKIMNMYIHGMYMVQTCMYRFAHSCGGGRIPDEQTPFDFRMFKIVTRAKANPAKRDPFAIRTWVNPPREGTLYHEAKHLIFFSETMWFV